MGRRLPRHERCALLSKLDLPENGSAARIRKVCDTAMFLVLFEPAGSIPAGETVCNISPKVFNQTEFLATRVLLFFWCHDGRNCTICVPIFESNEQRDLCTAHRCVLLCTQSRENSA